MNTTAFKLNTVQRAQGLLLQEIRDLENQIETETKLFEEEQKTADKLSHRLSCLSKEFERSIASATCSLEDITTLEVVHKTLTPSKVDLSVPFGEMQSLSLVETLQICAQVPEEVVTFIDSYAGIQDSIKVLPFSSAGFYESYGEYIEFLGMMIEIKEKLQVEKSQALLFVQMASNYLAHQYRMIQIQQSSKKPSLLGFSENVVHECLFTLSLVAYSAQEDQDEEIEIWKQMASTGLITVLVALYGSSHLIEATKTKILIILQYFFDAQNNETKEKSLQVFGMEYAPIIARILSSGTASIKDEPLLELYLHIVHNIFRFGLAGNLLHFGNSEMDVKLKEWPKRLVELMDVVAPTTASAKCIFGILQSMLDIEDLFALLNYVGIFQKCVQRIYSGLAMIEHEVKALIKAHKKRIIPTNILKPVLFTALFVYCSVEVTEKCYLYSRAMLDYLLEQVPRDVTSILQTIHTSFKTQLFKSEGIDPSQVLTNYKNQNCVVGAARKFGFFISSLKANSRFYHLTMGSITEQQLGNMFPVEPPVKNARTMSIKITKRAQSMPNIDMKPEEQPPQVPPTTPNNASAPLPEFDPVKTRTQITKKLNKMSFFSLAKRLFTPRSAGRRPITV